MVFIDFEVFAYDWLMVSIDPLEEKPVIIYNDKKKLEDYYIKHKNDIFVGFNIKRYDEYIFKSILLDMDPKEINDKIIEDRFFEMYSNVWRKIPMIVFDVMSPLDRGLKFFEGSMGSSIVETSIPFDINRKLLWEEMCEVIEYCTNDVRETINVFLERKADFLSQMELIKMYGFPLSDLRLTKVQLSAKILGACRTNFNDGWDVIFPHNHHVKKYQPVIDWFKNEAIGNEEAKLDIDIAGVPHTFGWGGVHGAIKKYFGEGYYINMDVASLYPNLMINYGLVSRACESTRFKEIVHKRLEYKKLGDPRNKSLKIVVNGTYGASLQKGGELYDPRMGRSVCLHGQILLLDLIEHLEPVCEIIQSNTDGVLVKLRDGSQKAFDDVDDIANEWEERTGLELEFDEYRKVIQKDVNNYIIVDPEGHYKSKGSYVKKLGRLDYDLPIVNKAVVQNLINNIPVRETVFGCKDLKEFQQIKKISSKYEAIFHGEERLDERCIRCFASNLPSDGGFFKLSKRTWKKAKIEGTPEHGHIYTNQWKGLGFQVGWISIGILNWLKAE